MLRHVVCGLLTLLALGICQPLDAGEKKDEQPRYLWVFFGTYSNGPSKGIYRATLDLATGKLSTAELAAELKNPSFLAIHPNRKYLYAVTETDSFAGKKRTGAVTAFTLNAKTGELERLNTVPSKGAGPCHIIVDKQGKNVLVANYSGGNAAVLPIQKDGSLGEATGFVQHTGKSVNKARQEGPHAHSINLDTANRFAFVADLGLDKVLIYRFDPTNGTITANKPADVKLAPGAGPRHFSFHPSGKFAYVINELTSTITAMKYNADKGQLQKLQTISTLPGGKAVKGNSTAEVVVHPSGKYVYGSNRGHNSIAIFAVNQDTGKLKVVGHQSYKINVPRNFAIDPTGKYLLAASQAGNEVVVFRIDPKSGELEPAGSVIEVPIPVCVRMLPRAE